MQLLVYLLVYPFLWVISILPFPLFYAVSDVICFIVFRIAGYRKNVVMENLKIAFPEKSEQELKHIRAKFYSHMCDLFLEMIKSLSISKKEIQKRFTVTNIEIFEKFAKENKSIILVCGHYASYEWMMSLGYRIDHKGYGVYMPLANKYFDRLVQKIRTRHGAYLIPMRGTTKSIIKLTEEGVLGAYGLISDQSPRPNRTKYWRPFFGVTVPVFVGAEKLAKELDLPVLFLDIQKVKRGYYETTIKTITENPREYPDYAITDRFTEMLEEQIRNKPEYYLWTHKRFKHRNKVPAKTIN